MFSSSGPREGKSTTVANLVITTSQMGLHTLLVDADLRRPTLHQLFGVRREPGLADILSHLTRERRNAEQSISKATDEMNSEMGGSEKLLLQQASVRAKRTVQSIASLDLAITAAVQPTVIENLEILTCGKLPSNPSELLASETMKDLLSLVKEKYEIVFIDAPPVIAVTDAAVLAPHVDGTALVIESGRNEKEIIQKAVNLLDRVGARVVGAVLNNVREKNLYGDYNYYYTYYSHDGQGGNRKKKRHKTERRR